MDLNIVLRELVRFVAIFFMRVGMKYIYTCSVNVKNALVLLVLRHDVYHLLVIDIMYVCMCVCVCVCVQKRTVRTELT